MNHHVRSIVALSCVVVLACWTNPRAAQGQAVEIEIRGRTAASETCLKPQPLSERVAHYSAAGGRPSGLRLVLYVTGPDAAELHILREESVLARRSFAGLPTACAERRDVVALSIALALERSASVPPAATGGEAAAGANMSRGDTTSAALSGGLAGPSGASRAGSESGAAASRSKQKGAGPQGEGPSGPAASGRSVWPPEGSRVTPSDSDNLPTMTSRDPRRRGPSASSLQLHLGGRFTLEAVPMPVWVGALGIELPVSPRVTLAITALISSAGESALAGARARARFFGLEAVGCSQMPLGLIMLQTCAGAAVALCDVSGRDYPRDRPEATLLWAAVLGRATLRFPNQGAIALRLLLQPHVSVSRPDLRVENSSEHLSTFWVGGTAGLELWLALP